MDVKTSLMDGWRDGQIGRCMEGMNGWMIGWIELKDGQIDGWIDK